MVAGGAAYERNTQLGREVGSHWRYYYNGMKEGTLNLSEEYKRYIRVDLWDYLKKRGIIVKNTAVRDSFKKNSKLTHSNERT